MVIVRLLQVATEDASFDCPVALALISATAFAWRLAHRSRPLRINNSLSPPAQAASSTTTPFIKSPFGLETTFATTLHAFDLLTPSYRIFLASKPKSASTTSINSRRPNPVPHLPATLQPFNATAKVYSHGCLRIYNLTIRASARVASVLLGWLLRS